MKYLHIIRQYQVSKTHQYGKQRIFFEFSDKNKV